MVSRAVSAPKEGVLSLDVLARAAPGEDRQLPQFRVLVRHFLERFFTNELASAEGDAKTRLVQVACALGIPGFLMAFYLYPVYHLPRGRVGRYWGVRSYWAQAGDHSFYVLYALVAMGLITIFEWDLFFPDLLDVFVLSPLPVRGRRMFGARVTAIFVLLGAALFDSSFLAPLVLPAATDPPHLFRFLAAHVTAVAAAGIFGAAFFLALEGLLLGVLGDRFFRRISLWLQGFSVMVLLTMLFLYPALFPALPVLLTPGRGWVMFVPPFWFLGIYQWILGGPQAPAMFGHLAAIGFAATSLVVGLAIVTYPVAWWRRTRGLVEGAAKRERKSRAAEPMRRIAGMMARTPACRAVWQFIGQNLLRVPRYRMVLVMVGGAGAALIFAVVTRVNFWQGHLRFVFSPDGLRATVPIVAFWTVSGLRSTFLAPADQRGRWIFRVVLGKPGWAEAHAAERWVLLWTLLLTVAAASGACLLETPSGNRGNFVAGQMLEAVGLSVLLTDVFFLNVKTIPFTGVKPHAAANFALLLIPYVGFFPAVVLFTVGLEPVIEAGVGHLALTGAIVVGAHLILRGMHRRRIAEFVQLVDADEDEEEFPLRLGLRY
ncbi:MAG TPA: hypothetical protein VHZ09_15650 [Acidobacteriaceae bacterium]|jgi:hypothetical protein|nr:hypothetical protein [Acidobacteriaceae bacterium]